MDDDVLKTESWDNLKELVSLTNSMLRRYQPEKSLEITETYLLELYFKLVISGVVEKRLAGLNEIKAFIKEVCEDDMNNRRNTGFQQRYFSSGGTPLSTPNPNAEPRVAKWHTPRAMAKWIDDKRLLEVLFHTGLHTELIRQSKAIILFISDIRGLKQSDVELIWRASVGKHESIQRAIYDLIIGIMPQCNSQTANLFFDQVETISNYAKVNEHTLEFLRVFVIEAVFHLKKSRDKKRKWFGLGIFWDILMNERLEAKVSQKAYECLKDLVNRDDFEPQRKHILKASLVSLKEHKCVPLVLSLTKTILKTYPITKKKKKQSVWGMLEYMNEKAKLYDLIFTDIQFASEQFQKEITIPAINVQQKQKSDKHSKKQLAGDDEQVTTNLAKERIDIHLSEMETRVDFLIFVMRHSTLTLTYLQVLSIWQTLYTQQIYKDLACVWLESLVKLDVDTELYFDVLADGVMEKIYQSILLKGIDIASMTPATLSLFHTYFVALNVKHRYMELEYEEQIYEEPSSVPVINLQPAEPLTPTDSNKSLGISRVGEKLFKNKFGNVIQHINRSDRSTDRQQQVVRVNKRRIIKRYIVLHADLIGMDYLWEIVLNVTDNSVAQKAVQYLNNYRNEFSRDMKAATEEYRESHINSCLDRLTSIYNNEPASPLKEQKIIRCLDVLLDYVYLFAEKTGVRGHGISSTGIPIRLRVTQVDGARFNITLQTTDSVSRLFHSIATELNQQDYLIQLFTHGNEIQNDGKTLDELGLRDHQMILVRKINMKDVGISLIKFQLKALGLEPLADALMKQSIEAFQHNFKHASDDTGEAISAITPATQDDASLDNDVCNSFNVIYFDSTNTILKKYVMLYLEDEKSYPTNILSRDENFMKLMSLLSASDNVAKKIWVLLLHLPTNTKMSKLIQDIANAEIEEQINWSLILPTDGSVHKLLYSLQIIDVCLKKQAKGTEKFDIEAWNDKFVKFGGVNHLINALPSQNSDWNYFAQTPLHKECLSLILKLINKFLPDYVTHPVVFDKIGISKIIQSVMRVVPVTISINAQQQQQQQQQSAQQDQQFDVEELGPISKRPTSKKYQFNQGFLNMIGSGTGLHAADRALIEQTMSFLHTSLSIDPNSLIFICQDTNFLSFLMSCLVKCEEKEIRCAVATGMENLLISNEQDREEISKKKSETLSYFIPLLFKYIHGDDFESTCDQYFTLLEKLLLDYQKVKNCSPISEDIFNEKNALAEVVKMVLKRPVVEERSTSSPDKVLVGLLRISTVLLRLNPDLKAAIGSKTGAGLIHEIFHSCLFQIPTATRSDTIMPPKCKSYSSRSASFDLLVELVNGCVENYRELLELVSSYLSKCERHSVWKFNTEAMERSELGFVGLQNQGATCYMNSLLQQLFMIIPLRKGLFSVELADPTSNENTNLLLQMQTLFGFLQNSAKRYYDTRPFCNSYKVDGQPVNCSQQQDATEFFNIFTDRVESALKQTHQENLLKKVFGGRIMSQLIYENQVSETIEPCSLIQLEIKNKKNVLESLDLYVAGDTLDGNNKYYSDKLQRHVEALKRYVLKDLPNVLIFQLKRFEFDYDKMRHVKLNDRCEFPLDIDMEPYTEEGMERREQRKLKEQPPKHRHPSYYKYRLVGVLVHMGSADSGHYYSYIMDRSSQSDNPQWFEFNDTKISKFEMENLEKQTFGGFEEIIVKDQGKTTVRNKLYRSNNAYMLFYQRTSTLFEHNFEEEECDTESTATNTVTHIEEHHNHHQEEQQQYMNEKKSHSGPISVDTIGSPSKLKNVPVYDDEQAEEEDQQHSEEKPQYWKSKPILAIKFLVKLSAAARRREAQQHELVDMPLAVKKIVWKDNSRFFHDKNVFNEAFDTFMWDLMSSNMNTTTNASTSLINSQLATRYVIDILAHSGHTKNLSKWFDYLRVIFSKDKIACQWFLESLIENITWRSELLFKCPDAELRQGFVSHLVECVRILLPDEKYDLEPPATITVQNTLVTLDTETQTEEQPIADPTVTIIRRFVTSIIFLLGEARYYTKQTTELFLFLSLLAHLDLQVRKYMIQKGLISIIVQLLNGDHPEPSKEFVFNKRLKATGLTGGFSQGAVFHMLQIMSTLVCTAETSSTKQLQNTKLPATAMRTLQDTPIDLPTKDRDKLFHRDFFACMIHDECNQPAVQNILIHWCWENMHVSTNFTDLIIKELPSCYTPSTFMTGTVPTAVKNHHLEHVLILLESMLSINDSLHKTRIEEIMKRFMRYVQTYMKDHDPTLVCVKFMTRQAGKTDAVKNWLIQEENKEDLQKICKYHEWALRFNPAPPPATSSEEKTA
jgi:ubiquitin C-terminal hydrolase